MARINFDEIAHYGQKSVPCSRCGQRLRRRRKFWQTENPFNKTPSGEIKSREVIRAELAEKAAQWQQEPETCRACAEPGDG